MRGLVVSAPWVGQPRHHARTSRKHCQRCGRESGREFEKSKEYVCQDCKSDTYWMEVTGHAEKARQARENRARAQEVTPA